MKKDRNETVVGFFVLIGLLILTVLIFFVSGVYLFRSGYSLNVMYDYVSILDRGAPVRLAGVRVGEVSRVDIVRDEKAKLSRVCVKLFIQKGVEVRENYAFKIQGTHILSEPHIEISPQVGEAPLIPPDTMIEGVAPVPVENLIRQADEIASQVSGSLKVIHEALQDKEARQAIHDILVNLSTLTQSMNQVMGGSDSDFKVAIKNIRTSSESLSDILGRIEKGEGTAGKLLTQDELYNELKAFVQEIKTHPWKLLKREGKRKKFLGIF